LGVARLNCAAVYRIYSTGAPPYFEEYFSDSVVAEEKFEQLKVQVDNGEYDEICLDDENEPDNPQMIDCYPTVSDGEGEGEEKEEDYLECNHCGILIARDGRDHNESVLSPDGEYIYCPECVLYCPDEEEGEEEGEGEKEEEAVGANGTPKKEYSVRVQNVLRELAKLFNESPEEYKSVFGLMGAKIKSLSFPTVPIPKCSCGVLLLMKKLRDGGKCTKCLKAKAEDKEEDKEAGARE
jgi:hypothetical protein